MSETPEHTEVTETTTTKARKSGPRLTKEPSDTLQIHLASSPEAVELCRMMKFAWYTTMDELAPKDRVSFAAWFVTELLESKLVERYEHLKPAIRQDAVDAKFALLWAGLKDVPGHTEESVREMAEKAIPNN